MQRLPHGWLNTGNMPANGYTSRPEPGVEKEQREDTHYWIGDGRDGRPIWEHIVCQIPHAEEPTIHGVFHVTIDKVLVGCQECLEFIHA